MVRVCQFFKLWPLTTSELNNIFSNGFHFRNPLVERIQKWYSLFAKLAYQLSTGSGYILKRSRFFLLYKRKKEKAKKLYPLLNKFNSNMSEDFWTTLWCPGRKPRLKKLSFLKTFISEIIQIIQTNYTNNPEYYIYI